MGDKRSQTCQGTWSKGQATNYHYSIFSSRWLLFAFPSNFPRHNHKSLPKLEGGREKCKLSGWNISYSYNHWSTLEMCKEFVEKILNPYLVAQIELKALPADQEMIWFIDYWSMHISK